MTNISSVKNLYIHIYYTNSLHTNYSYIVLHKSICSTFDKLSYIFFINLTDNSCYFLFNILYKRITHKHKNLLYAYITPKSNKLYWYTVIAKSIHLDPHKLLFTWIFY
jgi:hypothetical protein